THHGAQLHRNDITFGDVCEALPLPGARLLVDDLDPVSVRTLQPVAALRDDAPGGLLPVDEELRGLPRTIVGGHPSGQFLPLRAVDITQLGESDQSTVGGDHGVAGQAPGGGQQTRLRVAPTVALTDLEAVRPFAA